MPHRFHNFQLGVTSALFAVLCLFSIKTTQATVLRLGWDPSADPNITGYNVSYGTTHGKYTQTINVGGATSATVGSLTPATTYYFVVTAYNSSGLPSLPSNEVSLTTANNVPPSVSLTNPHSGDSFPQSAAISLAATASDSDGSVTKVEFYQGSTKIGTATSAPYSAAWNNAPSGNYVLTALAYDDSGTAVRSAGASITVGSGSQAPSPSPGVDKVRVVAMTPIVRVGDTARFKMIATSVDMVQPTVVNYSLTGSATGGVDYSMAGVTGKLTIPAGARAAMLPITTLSVPGRPGNKTAIVTVMPGTGYTPGRANAVVRIIGH